MTAYIVTPKARADLDNCVEYLGRDSLIAMERFVVNTRQTFEYPAANPHVDRWHHQKKEINQSAAMGPYGIFRITLSCTAPLAPA